jgi:hypothetical protein
MPSPNSSRAPSALDPFRPTSAADLLARALNRLPPHRPPIPAAQQSATPRHAAQHSPPDSCKTNPPHPTSPSPHLPTPKRPRPLRPAQLTAARLLLDGHPIHTVAAALRVHRYTITRWQKLPNFQAELRRQSAAVAAAAAAHNTAPQSATPRHIFTAKTAKRTQPPSLPTPSNLRAAAFPPAPAQHGATPRHTAQQSPPETAKRTQPDP